MKTAILYYTFGGATKAEAERLSKELGASLYRVYEKHNRSFLGSFIPGCPHAMKRKASKIKPLGVDLSAFDRIVIGCPIWAGYPAPAFNAIVELLPEGKDVELFFCSGGGEQQDEAGTIALAKTRGCKVTACRELRTEKKPSKLKGKR